MCNLYSYKMSADEMRRLMEHFKLLGTTWSEPIRARNAPIEDVYPNQPAPVVVVQNGERIVREDLLWGFPKFGGKGPYAMNFRNPKAHMWRSWLDKGHRCVVPATAFAEPDKDTSKPVVWRWFERPNREPFFFAGVWRPWFGDRGTNKAPNIGEHTLSRS
jgi:putative SOS response-associated peptidase YedK